MANAPLLVSSVEDIPVNARLLRLAYVSCKEYAEQGKTFKANAAAVGFFVAVPFTILGFAACAAVCPVLDIFLSAF